MNAIAKQTTSAGRPSILSSAALERINVTFVRIVPVGARGELAAHHAPTDNERHAMRGRLAELNGAVEPAPRQAIETMVGSLLAGYPAGRAHRDDADAVLKMFVQALSGLPTWAISSACAAWNRGEAGSKNTNFAPAPSDLREVALGAMREFETEKRKITAILNAEIIQEPEPDEVRSAVAARVRSFNEGIAPKKEPVAVIEDYEAWEKRQLETIRKENAEGRYRLSPEALGVPASTERAA